MTENINKLIDRIEAIAKACRVSLAYIPAPVQDALTAAHACVRTTRAWQEQAGNVQRSMFGDDTPKVPAYVPYASGSSTSLKAAGSISSSGSAIATRSAVLATLSKGPKTCDEIEELFQRRDREMNREPRSWGSSIRPRLVELRDRGFVFLEGERGARSGRMAAINHISEAGRMFLSRVKKGVA